jgi:3-vinyl bacteriochlorophyllide hydratase
LAAYVAYLINAAQFLWKLRVARYEGVSDETVLEEERNISGGMAT